MNDLKFNELNPKWLDENRHFIEFDCPVCRKHRVVIHIRGGKLSWTVTNDTDWEHITVQPSINNFGGSKVFVSDEVGWMTECPWHGFITDGKVITC